MSQMKLDGTFMDDPIEFDCPICGQHIICKRDNKGNVYHRNWMFHWTYEHGKTALVYCKEDITLWLWYFCFPIESGDPVGSEMLDRWNSFVVLERANL